MIRLLALLFVAACASAPPPRPARNLPPPSAWTDCDTGCAREGSTFIGILFPSAFVSTFVCVCSLRPGPAPDAS